MNKKEIKCHQKHLHLIFSPSSKITLFNSGKVLSAVTWQSLGDWVVGTSSIKFKCKSEQSYWFFNGFVIIEISECQNDNKTFCQHGTNN